MTKSAEQLQLLQGVATLIVPVEPFVTGIKMKSRDQHAFALNHAIKESRNQGMFQIGDQAAHRRIRVSKTYIHKVFARISSDQGPFLSAIKQSK